MSTPAHQLKDVSAQKDGKTARPKDSIKERSSKELVIALAGPIGCGIKDVKKYIESALVDIGYDVVNIKISDYLVEYINNKVINFDKLETKGAARYIQMQEAGNRLREKQTDILAEVAITKIAEDRIKKVPLNTENSLEITPSRTAYIIDQLKHPDEAELLRTIYGNIFYLFGVLSTASRRITRLRTEEQIDQSDSINLIERDRKQSDNHGQQLDKVLQLADFFIRNDHSNSETPIKHLRRFIDLIHGVNGFTPTREEFGMYSAYAAGQRSACLSRQVGASIMNRQGNIISTGRNDVPKAGGGLYEPEDGEHDARCVKWEGNRCHNDAHKMKLSSDIQSVFKEVLEAELKSIKEKLTDEDKKIIEKIDPAALSDRFSLGVQERTRVDGLIEFSRSIHAEMDAIISLSRQGGGSTQGASLFTYTYPCHNCARHIVTAGIQTVYFLEPYEKSLASVLHHDSIDIEGKRENTEEVLIGPPRKVRFLHFEGVAPRQYQNMFTIHAKRKDQDGSAITVHAREANKKIPEFLDDYRDYEKKVVEHLHEVISRIKQSGV